jgi:hypothetical protein
MAILTILHSIRACFVVDHTSLNFRHRWQEEYFRLHDDVLRHCLHLFPGVLPRSFIVHVLFFPWFVPDCIFESRCYSVGLELVSAFRDGVCSAYAFLLVLHLRILVSPWLASQTITVSFLAFRPCMFTDVVGLVIIGAFGTVAAMLSVSR